MRHNLFTRWLHRRRRRRESRAQIRWGYAYIFERYVTLDARERFRQPGWYGG